MSDNRRFVLEHLKSYAMRVSIAGEEFKLASGKKSRLYVDAKKTYLSRSIHYPLAQLLYEQVRSLGHADAVAGVVLGGCHLASLLATYAAIKQEPIYNVIYVRKLPKDHGTKNCVEKAWSRFGEWVVLLEDVISTGATSAHAVAALREEGFSVRGVVVLLDRRLPQDRTSTIDDVPLRSVYQLEDLELTNMPETAALRE